jgi:acyl-CoA thioester hydrolase
MESRFTTQTTVTARFSDTDAMGHVNNARFISFMEEGRVCYFRKLYPKESLARIGELFPFILADIQCSFKKPVFCSHNIITTIGVTHFGTKSFTFEYDLFEEESGDLVATGKSIQVMYDYKTNQTIDIPQSLKDAVAEIEGKAI